MKSSTTDLNRYVAHASVVVIIVGILVFLGGMEITPMDSRSATGSGESLGVLQYLLFPDRAMAADEEIMANQPAGDVNERASASAARAWVKQYNNAKYGLTDVATAIALDREGNVVVTGSSATPLADIVTIKYDPAGTKLWTAKYNGPDGGSDVPAAIAVDSNNNVLVVGGSAGAETNSDFVTIKYSPSGKELWVKRYDGSAHGFDTAIAVAVDTQGNVYVTGSSDPTGLGNFDYLTLKYDPDGKRLWVARYNGPSNLVDTALAIAVDSSGNPCVTGQSNGTLKTKIDIATIKYNGATGKELWATRYDSPQHFLDVGRAITVDSKGNVYVVGEASVGLTQDFVTIKYDAGGKEMWVKHYNGPGDGADVAKAVALDSKGYVCVAGDVWDNATDWDYGVIKYSKADGAEFWVASYDGPAHKTEQLKGMAVDGAGNVYVTGDSLSEKNADFATVRFNASGKQTWAQRYNGTGKDADVPSGIVVDSSKNVYVTGWTTNSESWEDYATIKYTQQ